MKSLWLSCCDFWKNPSLPSGPTCYAHIWFLPPLAGCQRREEALLPAASSSTRRRYPPKLGRAPEPLQSISCLPARAFGRARHPRAAPRPWPRPSPGRSSFMRYVLKLLSGGGGGVSCAWTEIGVEAQDGNGAGRGRGGALRPRPDPRNSVSARPRIANGGKS
jgi:hypothetical protein